MTNSLRRKKQKSRRRDQRRDLQKFAGNPILKPLRQHPWESKYVFNPAALYLAGRVHLIYRAIGDDDVSVLGYAASTDGFHIDERSNEPIYKPSESFESVTSYGRERFFVYSSGGGVGGCEDPRVTLIDDTIYMTYVAFNGWEPPRVALTSIKVNDFLNKRWRWRRPVLLSPPGEIHKNWVIFPEKINGKYAILHSICPKVLIDYFDSLEFDGQTYIKSRYYRVCRRNCWDSWVRGVGAPPIKTKYGWLVFYHAMEDGDWGRYKIGAMLLDLEDPTRVVSRCKAPLLEPTEDYENRGFKPGVVYTCGAVVVDDRLFVYYGGADTVSCVATTPLQPLLDWLRYSKLELNEQS
jgi:predicted GH43/DUF377 family glycosyl hydrolase